MGQRSDELDRDDRLDVGSIDDGAISDDQNDTIDSTSENTAEIRAGIEQTRSEMSETIEAIQERLSPQHLKEQVKDTVREQFYEAKETVREATIGKAEEFMRNAGDTVNEARYGLMETIRQNPIPAAMVGLGLGWLYMNRRSGGYSRYDQNRYRGYNSYDTSTGGYGGPRYAYGVGERYQDRDMYDRGQGESTLGRAQHTAGQAMHRAQDTVGSVVGQAQDTAGHAIHRAQDAVGNVVNQAQDTVGNVVSQTQETAGYIADQAQFQAQRFEDRFERTLHENPLMIGAVALALGTAVGMALPGTERENQLLGEARDNMVDRAQSLAQDTMEKVQRVAGDVIDEVQETASESAREQGLSGERQQERGA
jgi:hypothetical protein